MPYSTRKKKRFPFVVVSVNTDGSAGSVVRRNTTYAKAVEFATGRIRESGNTKEYAVLVRPSKNTSLQRFGALPTATELSESTASLR